MWYGLLLLLANVALLNQATEIGTLGVLSRAYARWDCQDLTEKDDLLETWEKGKFQADVNKTVQLSHRKGAR